MKKDDLIELNSNDLAIYKNQLESMIKEEKKLLYSLQIEEYEIREKNKFLKEHAEELTRIVNICHQGKNFQSIRSELLNNKFLHDQQERIFKLSRSLQFIFPSAQFLNNMVHYPQHIIDKLQNQQDQPSTWQHKQSEIVDIPQQFDNSPDKNVQLQTLQNQSTKSQVDQQNQTYEKQLEEHKQSDEDNRVQRFENIKNFVYEQDEI